MIFAIGALVDPNEAPYNLEAEKYHQLSRAALFKSSIFDDPTLHAVQALVSSKQLYSWTDTDLLIYLQFLMTYYLFISDRHGTGTGSRWIIMGFAVKLAQSVSAPYP